MEEDLQHAISVLGDFSGLFDPFRIIRMRGIDGAVVFDAILPRVVHLGAGILVIMALFELLGLTIKSTAAGGRSVPILGVLLKIALAAGGLLAYKPFVVTACSVFPLIGERILGVMAEDVGIQVGSALATIQIESISQFKLWTGTLFDLTVSSLVAAVLSFLGLILLWVMSLLQGFLWTLWYLVGPLALPCMVFSPMAHVMRNWMMSILGVAFWSVTGSLMAAIAVKAQFLDKSFAAGSMGDVWVSIVYSALSVLLMISTVGLAQHAFSAIDLGIQGAFQSAKSLAKGALKKGEPKENKESKPQTTSPQDAGATLSAQPSGGI